MSMTTLAGRQGRWGAWLDALAVYREPRVIAVFFLGFASGLPLPLTFGTLTIWLSRYGISKTTIGLFALVGVPYSLKFLWAPLIDQIRLPLLAPLFGRRRAWLLLTQAALIASLIGLGLTDPAADVGRTALLAVIVAFCSASQDIVIDAYRIEILDERQQGAGAAMVVYGYRVALLVSGAGALFLASSVGWHWTYAAMAALMLVGVATVLLSPEPAVAEAARLGERAGFSRAGISQRLPGWLAAVVDRLWTAVVEPFGDFMRRRGWFLVLLFILTYKLGDAVAGVMANPFYVELGFTDVEIASISKAFGFWATLVGAFVGGLLVSRFGIFPALLISGVLQMVSNAVFALQAVVGHDLTMLTLTIGFENLAGGMGTTAFVAYLSGLCNVAYTATQYALLSSLMAVARTTLAAPAGRIADATDWVSFFLLTTVAALPGLILLVWMRRRFPADSPADTAGPGSLR